MTAVAVFPGARFGWSRDYEPASTASRDIERVLDKGRNFLQGSAADWLPLVESALRSIKSECGRENWDGMDAYPVSEVAIKKVGEIATVLFNALPRGTPAPDIVPEPDGEIGITWTVDPHRVLSLSVGAHDKINFAGQFRDEGGVHGWQRIDSTSYEDLEQSLQEVCRLIKRLYK